MLGIGTAPRVPAAVDQGEYVHSADYLPNRDRLRALDSITVIGSGQSAAEIYLDLLNDIETYGYHLSWITRSFSACTVSGPMVLAQRIRTVSSGTFSR